MKKLRDSQVLHVDLDGILTPVWLISVFPNCISCVKVSDKSFITVSKELIKF